MPNILIDPKSGFLEFNTGSASGSAFDASLSGAARFTFRNSGELNLTTLGTGVADKFTVDGSNGRLLTVNNTVTGSIFSVNDVAGLPIVEVFSNDRVVMGQYATDALVVSGSNVTFGKLPTISGNPVMTGSSAFESDTLQTVTDRGATTTNTLSLNDGVSVTDSVHPVTINRTDGSSALIHLKTQGGARGYLGASSTDAFNVWNANPHRLFTILTGGNVGIGVPAPTEKLEVSGNIKISSDGVGNSASSHELLFFGTNSGGTQIDQAAILSGPWATNSNGGELIFQTSNSSANLTERIRIDGQGFVGIGSNDPQANLDVTTTANNQHLKLQGAYGEGVGALAIIKTTANGNALNVESASTSSSREIFEVKNGNGAIFDILGNGCVGIGSAIPSSKLEVSGSVSNSIASFRHGHDGIELTTRSSNGRQQIDFLGTNTSSINAKGSLFINYDTDNDGSNDNIKFTRNGADEAGTVDMVLKEGNLGIGTGDPNYALDVHGDGKDIYLRSNDHDIIRLVSVSSDVDQGLFSVYHDGTEEVRLRGGGPSWIKGGEVGIGTNNPAKQLTLNAAEPFLRLEESSSGGNKRLDLFVSQSTGVIAANQSAQTMMFQTVGTTRMTIAAGGSVGINVAAPAGDKLMVKAENNYFAARLDGATTAGQSNGLRVRAGYNSTDRPVLIEKADGSDVFIIDGLGYVGIGSASPTSPLTFNAPAVGLAGGGVAVTEMTKTIATTTIGVKLGFTGGQNSTNNIIGGLSMGNVGEEFAGMYAIDGGASASTHLALFAGTAGGTNEVIRINSDRTVGIGTTNPSAFNSEGRNLVVGSGVGAQGMSIFAGTSSSASIYFADGTAGSEAYQGWVQYRHGDSRMDFGAAGGARMRMNGNGLLIAPNGGATSPSAELEIASSAATIRLTDSDLTNHYSEIEKAGVYTYLSSRANAADGGFIFFGGGTDTEFMRIATNGNVGIGTNSPSGKLHIFDTGSPSGDIFNVDGSHGRLFNVSDETTGIIFSVNDAAGLPIIEVNSTSGWDKVSIGEFGQNALLVSGGNVGIGKTNPLYKLEIDGGDFLTNTANGGYIQIDESDNSVKHSDNIFAKFGTSNDMHIGHNSSASLSIYDHYNHNVLFRHLTNDKDIEFQVTSSSSQHSMLLLDASTQRVGIGSATPAYKLDVAGQVGASGLHVDGDVIIDTSTASNALYVTRLGNTNESLKINVDDSSAIFEVIQDENSHAYGNFHFKTDVNDDETYYRFDVGGSEKMRLNKSGLEIKGNQNADHPRIHFQASDNSNRFTIETDLDSTTSNDTLGFVGNFGTAYKKDILFLRGNGDVGIGTNNPGEKLVMRSSNADCVLLLSASDSTTHNSTIKFGDNDSSSRGIIQYAHNGDSMRFTTAATEAVRIDSSQRVGIGTNSILGMLQVNGRALVEGPSVPTTITISDSGDASKALRLGYEPTWDVGSISASDYGAGWKNIVIAPHAGKVGIGTTSPHQALSVKGTIVAYNSSYVQVAGMTNSSDAGRLYANNDGGVTKVLLDSAGVSYLNGGNVGIGLVEPQQELHVSGDIRLGGGGAGQRIEFARAGGTAIVGGIGWHTDSKFYVAGHPSVGPTAGNDVRVYGFGSDLHLGDSTNGDVVTVRCADGSTHFANRVRIGLTGNVGIGGNELVTISGGGSSVPSQTWTNAKNSALYLRNYNNAAGEWQLQPYNGGNGGVIQLAPYGGNVTIGNTTASAKLDIRTDAGTAAIRAESSSGGYFLVDHGGRVGIQTHNPTYALHIDNNGNNSAANVLIDSTTTADASISFSHNGTFGVTIGTDESDGKKFKISSGDALGTNDRFVIDNQGNVGIGSASPAAFLDVSKDNSNAGNQLVVADTEGASAAVRTYTHGGSPAGLILNHYYAVAGSSNEYMRYADFVANISNGAGTTMRFITKNAANTYSTTVIDNNGNVGIGSAAPSGKLDVAGTINALGGTITGHTSEIGPSDASMVINDGDYIYGRHASNYLRRIIGRSSTAVEIGHGGTSLYGQTKFFAGSNAESKYSFHQSSNELVRITCKSDGTARIGVGTNTATQALDVVGYINFANTRSNNTQKIARILVPEYDNTNDGFLSFMGTANSTSNFVSYGGGTSSASAATVLAFYTSTGVGIHTGTERMRIDKDGNISLGAGSNNADGARVHIAGEDTSPSLNTTAIDDCSLVVGNSDKNYGMVFGTRGGGQGQIQPRRTASAVYYDLELNPYGGNVGIGTESPSYKLTVNGDIVGSSKSFLIDHPTQSGKQLMHACIEGPENGVYYRGKSQNSGIQAPEYWTGLVHVDSMTVDVTPIGPNQSIYIDRIEDNGDIYVGSNTDEPLNYFYVVYGERKDINKLEVVKDRPLPRTGQA